MGELHLTNREFDVLARLDRQMPEIVKDIGISVGAYRVYYARLAKKMKRNTRTAIVLKAIKLGIIQPEAYESYHEP